MSWIWRNIIWLKSGLTLYTLKLQRGKTRPREQKLPQECLQHQPTSTAGSKILAPKHNSSCQHQFNFHPKQENRQSYAKVWNQPKFVGLLENLFGNLFVDYLLFLAILFSYVDLTAEISRIKLNRPELCTKLKIAKQRFCNSASLPPAPEKRFAPKKTKYFIFWSANTIFFLFIVLAGDSQWLHDYAIGNCFDQGTNLISAPHKRTKHYCALNGHLPVWAKNI